ncbi:glycosyl hydrolase family 61-domain-containing protein [Paraphoma chrysanthemicola]|nr:glycosyl hydrolase family 61-domain-containing protein [Paraphoma chrysanthemicola]
MKTQSMLLAALASVPAALAHTVFTDFYVDGVPQGDGVAIRMNPNSETAGSPIGSLDSEDMACNVGGTKGVSRVQPVKDGALLTFEIRSWANDPTKERLDRGHYGPCAVYLKKVASAIDDKATGDGWFKIFDHGYDASSKRWCTDEIIDNNGLLSVNLPKGLEGGSYLARPEILALHAANSGDPQFYTGCAQIFLESSGNLGPASTVSIPGYVKYGQPSTSFDIYNSDISDYPVPGPEVAKLVAKSDAGVASQTQTEGLKPEGCLVENGNWCGKEVSSYSDEKGCWASAEECWDQSETCWDSTLPTGGAGCDLWQTKCKEIQNACNSKNFNGPPNKGKVLTPEKKAIDVGLIMATVGGGVIDAPAPKTSATKKEEAKTETPAKQTPAANDQADKEDENKPDTPAQSPAYTTPAAAAKPSSAAPVAPKPTPSNTYSTPETDDEDSEDDEPAPVVTKPASSAAAPKPTQGPPCVPGGKCVTVTEIETVVKTVYVTAAYDGYKRGLERMRRRRAHHI